MRMKTPPNLPTENDLQLDLVDHLIEKHPAVIFRSDLGGIRLPPGLIKKVKKLSRGRESQGAKIPYPDFFIAEPRSGWCGLYIELKRRTREYAVGKNLMLLVLKVDEHTTEQASILRKLRAKGYCAEFAGGWANIKHLVEWYLSLPATVRLEGDRPCWPFTVFRKNCP